MCTSHDSCDCMANHNRKGNRCAAHDSGLRSWRSCQQITFQPCMREAAATHQAPTLAALSNFTPDACDGRVASEESLFKRHCWWRAPMPAYAAAVCCSSGRCVMVLDCCCYCCCWSLYHELMTLGCVFVAHIANLHGQASDDQAS